MGSWNHEHSVRELSVDWLNIIRRLLGKHGGFTSECLILVWCACIFLLSHQHIHFFLRSPTLAQHRPREGDAEEKSRARNISEKFSLAPKIKKSTDTIETSLLHSQPQRLVLRVLRLLIAQEMPNRLISVYFRETTLPFHHSVHCLLTPGWIKNTHQKINILFIHLLRKNQNVTFAQKTLHKFKFSLHLAEVYRIKARYSSCDGENSVGGWDLEKCSQITREKFNKLHSTRAIIRWFLLIEN